MFLSPGMAMAGSLSDLTPTSTAVGWGRLQVNQNVCKDAPIRIRGTTFEQGITAHASSVVRYDLGGSYNIFSAVIGIDDSANSPTCGGSPLLPPESPFAAATGLSATAAQVSPTWKAERASRLLDFPGTA